ncbi:hypothetical protein SKAU_G00253060 [Synaphobranchus kaupii]|uniref:Uncharacterized protein n=1 Tax=Synaphobranchus kaupii TaxID=118154 RepID=A0A9Q1F3C6_SYNKA|nr:hypothetical protein SKAU_G00253060 [Synaphobranchus kaupii]
MSLGLREENVKEGVVKEEVEVVGVELQRGDPWACSPDEVQPGSVRPGGCSRFRSFIRPIPLQCRDRDGDGYIVTQRDMCARGL